MQLAFLFPIYLLFLVQLGTGISIENTIFSRYVLHFLYAHCISLESGHTCVLTNSQQIANKVEMHKI